MYGGRRIIEVHPETEGRDRLISMLEERGQEFEEVGNTLYIFQTGEARFDEEFLASMGHFNYRTPTLEDVFLKLTGRSLNE